MKKLILLSFISTVYLHAQQPHNKAFKAECHKENSQEKYCRQLNYAGMGVVALKVAIGAQQVLAGENKKNLGPLCAFFIAEAAQHAISGYKNNKNSSKTMHETLIATNIMSAALNYTLAALIPGATIGGIATLVVSGSIQAFTAWYKWQTQKPEDESTSNCKN